MSTHKPLPPKGRGTEAGSKSRPRRRAIRRDPPEFIDVTRKSRDPGAEARHQLAVADFSTPTMEAKFRRWQEENTKARSNYVASQRPEFVEEPVSLSQFGTASVPAHIMAPAGFDPQAVETGFTPGLAIGGVVGFIAGFITALVAGGWL